MQGSSDECAFKDRAGGKSRTRRAKSNHAVKSPTTFDCVFNFTLQPEPLLEALFVRQEALPSWRDDYSRVSNASGNRPAQRQTLTYLYHDAMYATTLCHQLGSSDSLPVTPYIGVNCQVLAVFFFNCIWKLHVMIKTGDCSII